MKKTILLTILVLLASISIAYAVDLPPTATIIATPGTTVNTTVTITVQAIDVMDNAGLTRVELYYNNNLNYTQNCSAATSCTLVQTFAAIYPVNMSFYGIAYDLGSNTRTTNTITITFNGVNTPPNLTGLPARTINEDSGLNANLTNLWNYVNDTWTLPQNLVYTILNQSNITVANCVITANQWIDCSTPTLDAFGTSTIIVQAFDGVLYDNDTFVLTVAPVNDPPVFNTTIPTIVFAEDTNYTFNISDYFYDVDNQLSQLTFTNSNISNMTVQYLKTGNLTEVRLTSAANFTGILYINFTANDGANSSLPSNNVLINVTPVNDAPLFTTTAWPVGAWQDVPFSYKINSSDVDAGDVLAFYDNTSLFDIDLNTGWINFTATNLSNNTILITVCDNSGAATNCTNITWSFNVYLYPSLVLEDVAVTPQAPANYSPNATYNFSVRVTESLYANFPLSQDAHIDNVWLEFNGTNYTRTANYSITGQLNRVNLSGLIPANYTYIWHANLTNGLHYNTSVYNYTLNKAVPVITITAPSFNFTYGSQANVTCNTTASQVQPLLNLYRNGTSVGNPDGTWLNAGSYNYTCTTPETQNYTAASAAQIMTVNPAQAVISLNVLSPITYNASANVTCSAGPSYLTFTPTLTRNGTALSGLNDTSLLAAGTYNYTCYYNTTANILGDSKTAMLTVNKATPVTNLTIGGNSGDIYLPANTTLPYILPVINGITVIPSTGYMELYINNTLVSSGNNGISAPLFYPINGSVPITLIYNATQNYSQGSVTYWVYIGTPVIKSNITPASGSSFNATSFALNFTTNLNVSCNWSLNPASVNTVFSTTGQTTHSTSITGLVLGQNNVYVACTNDTSPTNLSYTVQNIFSGTTAIINGATANNSVLANTPVSNSTLQTVNASNSAINGSILTNCTVINSTVKNYRGNNCYIANSWVDPPNPGSDLTGSTILGNSTIYNSNVTYSYVDNSGMRDSNVNNSNITNQSGVYNYAVVTNSVLSTYSSVSDNSIADNVTLLWTTVGSNSIVRNSSLVSSTVLNASNILNSLIDHVIIGQSNITNSTIYYSELYNATVINANITNGRIYSGIMTQGNFTYNATASGPANVSDMINLPPHPSWVLSPTNPVVSQPVIFNASNSWDSNIGSILNDSITVAWNFGDGTNGTGAVVSHTYSTIGTYTVTITVTDRFGLSGTSYRSSLPVSAAGSGGTGGTGGSSGGGGGGGGGGGASPYGREWSLNLDKRGVEIIILGSKDTAKILLENKTHVLKMTGIDRTRINFTLDNVPYSFVNQEIRKVNLDNDGYSDMRIFIMNNYLTRAQFRFDRFHEPMMGFVAPPLFNFTETQPEEQPPVTEEQPPVAEQPPVTEEKPPITEQPPAEGEITEGFFSRMISKIPANNTMIGAGITLAIVIIGLLIYWLFAMIFI